MSNPIQVQINKELWDSQDAELRGSLLTNSNIRIIKNLQADIMQELANRQIESKDDVVAYARFQGDCQGQLKMLNHLLELHLNAHNYILQTPQTNEGE